MFIWVDGVGVFKKLGYSKYIFLENTNLKHINEIWEQLYAIGQGWA